MAGRIPLPPTVQHIASKDKHVDLWFTEVGNRCNLYRGTTNPTVASVPENQWIMFYNTALGEIRIWTNIAGVLKKSAAFT